MKDNFVQLVNIKRCRKQTGGAGSKRLESSGQFDPKLPFIS